MTNTNMRKGFTMIELIFVIVIIGILAAVAIPKLAATRDDAKISSIVANTRTIVGDVTTYYTSQGEKNYLLAQVNAITDVPLFTNATCTTQAATTTKFAGTTLYICDDTKDALIIASTKVAPMTLTLKQGSSTSTISKVLAKDPTFLALTNGKTGKITTLGGSRVVR